MSDIAEFSIMHSLERLIALTPQGRAHLEQMTAHTLELKPHRKLIDEHRPCDHMFVVKSGWLVQYRQLRDGQKQILNFRLPGEVAGIECLIYRTALHSTSALTPATVVPISRDAFERTQQRFPKLASAFLLTALRDGAIQHEWAVNLGRRAAFQRVAHLLLELERRLRATGLAGAAPIPFPLKQQDIADCTALTTPYVNRVLQQMRGKSLVTVGDGALEIRDATALALAAGFRPDYLQTSARIGEVAPPPAMPDREHNGASSQIAVGLA